MGHQLYPVAHAEMAINVKKGTGLSRSLEQMLRSVQNPLSNLRIDVHARLSGDLK
jgi:hypothetical protein